MWGLSPVIWNSIRRTRVPCGNAISSKLCHVVPSFPIGIQWTPAGTRRSSVVLFFPRRRGERFADNKLLGNCSWKYWIAEDNRQSKSALADIRYANAFIIFSYDVSHSLGVCNVLFHIRYLYRRRKNFED